MGFQHIACTQAAEVPQHALFTAWLAADRAGEMTYLARDSAIRQDPRQLLAGAQSILCVALSYFHAEPTPSLAEEGLRGQIARYARGEDYHLVLKQRLNALAVRLCLLDPSAGVAYRACVDTAPLLERALAAQAGLGFIGKNSLLISPGVGSYTVLGELLLTVALPTNQPLTQHCGTCRLCIDACPTAAILDNNTIDARRCISYLTIENPGPIPLMLRRAIGTWVFGCDICQEVCPWNASPQLRSGRAADSELRPRPQQSRPLLIWLLGLGAAQFRRFIKRTALRRIGRRQLLRNVAVALGNVGTAQEVPALAAALATESALVRQHVAWALGEIGQRDPSAFPLAQTALMRALALETDTTVRRELEQALQVGLAAPNAATVDKSSSL